MQLFAIIANADRLTAQSRQIVESFLRQQLSREQVGKHLLFFDEYLESHKGKGDADKIRKRTSVNSVKVLKICTDINQELNQRQKYIVLIRLVEFIYSSDEPVTEQEWEFVSTVASIFNIPENDYKDCISITSKYSVIPDSSTFLLISGNTTSHIMQHTSFVRNADLNGHILILFIKSIRTIFFKYAGDSQLTLNGQTFSNDFVQVFTQGSVLRGNKIEPVYYSDVIHRFLKETHQEKTVFAVNDITYRFSNGSIGMHPVSFTAGSGELIGIMGGSGAGKSTLLNLLNGNFIPTTGKVLINGNDLHHDKKQTEGIIGYIPQDDLLMEDLTVFQNVYYNTKLSFGDLEESAITQKVFTLLESLGLSEIKDLKVGNALNKTISGGQRKRLNIALELVREPAVMFVDEPTSGLSSRDSENVMDLQKQLAINGKLIFVVIHQPSSDIFKLFDKLLLLDTGGFPIYYGNPSDSLIYFKKMTNMVNADSSECELCGNINPEQLFTIIEARVIDEFGNAVNARKITPAGWNELYLKSLNHANRQQVSENKNVERVTRKPSWLKQFKVFITRDILSKISNTQYLLINLLEAPILAFTLAFLVRYYQSGKEYIYRENQNIPAFIFISVLVALFMGLTVSAEEIFRDRKIRTRESFLNLSLSSYLFSKILVMFILSAIQTMLFVIIGNTVLDIKGMYTDYWLMLFTTSCFANLLGLNISSAFNSAVTIYILIPILIIPQILLSGIIVKFEKLNPVISTHVNVPICGEIMTSRWAFEGLAVHQFKENKYESIFFDDDQRMSKAVFQKDFLIPELIKRTDYSILAMTQPEKKEMLPGNLHLLRKEIGKQNSDNPAHPFNKISQLTVPAFNASLGNELKQYLNGLKSFYIGEYNNANEHKESIVSKYEQTTAGGQSLLQMKDDYQNESLVELLKNTTERKQIEETNAQLIQRFQPIYMEGDKTSFIRAPFFASRKNVFGNYYDTYLVDIIVIWMMSLILYIALYFGWLKKLLNLGDRFSIKSRVKKS